MASTSSEELTTLEHQGPAISKEYYPEYAETAPVITTLYSNKLFVGSTILLLSMCMLGLPITAFGHYFAEQTSVNLWVAFAATAANVVVFAVGLAIVMISFRMHGQKEGH